MSTTALDRANCAICGQVINPQSRYFVRIDAFADPSVPPITMDELSADHIEQTFDTLLEQMKHLTAEELQDGVHRRFEYVICPTCHKRFLANPLGMPRIRKTGEN